MNPVMYLLSSPSVEMSRGKRDAQAGHAAVEAYRLTPDNNVKRMWDCGGHYAKVSLSTDDLRNAQTYIEARGFKTVLILDEGRTEFEADLTPTFLGVEILDKDNIHVRETFGAFKLVKDPVLPPKVGDGVWVFEPFDEGVWLEHPTAGLPLERDVKRSIKTKLKERFFNGNTPQRRS